MVDERVEKLAELILNYSIELKKEDKLLIQFDPVYLEYAIVFEKIARNIGAEVKLDSTSFDTKCRRNFIENIDKNEWAKECERRKELALWCNTRVLIDCDSNPDYAKGIPDAEKKISDFSKEVIGPYRDILYRPGKYRGCAVRWNIVGFPYLQGAEKAKMSQEDFADFVYSATIKNDWKKASLNMKKIKNLFDDANEVRIVVPGLTDLRLSLSGRGGEICEGKCNMPDGEVCYGPVENSANGRIYFQIPTERGGLGVLQGIELVFENGKVKEHSARENQKALDETLKIDDGVKRIGELGIGCNYGIKKAIINTLFDEKIGGTIHLALGHSLSENLLDGGGLNKSNIHWDLVCDLRRDEKNLAEYPGGEIYVDGKLVQKNGEWIF